MTTQSKGWKSIIIPDGLIVFISGVPGMGKTTISYELLKNYSKFRIVEETDLIRETLRGYNDYLRIKFANQVSFIFDNITITDHKKLLTFEEAKLQCEIMKHSLTQIVARQQRKGIATIINGVHIVPEVLADIIKSPKTIFINLYVTSQHEIYKRIFGRDATSYMLENLPLIFQTNAALQLSTENIMKQYHNVYNVNVTSLSIEETVNQIIDCIQLFQL